MPIVSPIPTFAAISGDGTRSAKLGEIGSLTPIFAAMSGDGILAAKLCVFGFLTPTFATMSGEGHDRLVRRRAASEYPGT
jgi:hypothetical protein